MEVERQVERGELDLIYVAPERLVTPRFLDLLDRAKVCLFALDEAHCVSQWGHDFRPEYLQLSILHELSTVPDSADRDGRRPDPRRHPGAAEPGRRRGLHRQLRPAEYHLPRAAQAGSEA